MIDSINQRTPVFTCRPPSSIISYKCSNILCQRTATNLPNGFIFCRPDRVDTVLSFSYSVHTNGTYRYSSFLYSHTYLLLLTRPQGYKGQWRQYLQQIIYKHSSARFHGLRWAGGGSLKYGASLNHHSLFLCDRSFAISILPVAVHRSVFCTTCPSCPGTTSTRTDAICHRLDHPIH